MCNFNQVFRGKQRYHYSCCRRRMHQIVAAPCCSSGHNRVATEESIEMCWPRTCPENNGTAKIPSVEKTSIGEQLPRKSPSSTPKIPHPSKTNPLPKETASQKHSNNKLNDNSVSSTSKKLSRGSPVQTNISHKVSVNNSVKMARLSGGSIEIKKKKKSCICTSCEVDSLISVCSSEHDYGSPLSMSSPKTSKKCKKTKPCKSRLEPQDTDLKALVRTKPKRKKILQRRWPTRSPECARLDGPNTQQTNIRFDESNSQQTNEDDGVWFECNLPFRVNIPIPISFRNLFSLQSSSNNASQGRAIVPARNCGNCLTMSNALPAPVPEPQPQPQPVTSMRGRRRLKTRPSVSPSPSPNLSPNSNPSPNPSPNLSSSPNPSHNPSPCPYPCPYHGPYPGPCPRSCSYPCETSTQTGVEESDLLRCLYEIKNQLAAKATECHCFAEKSTYVRTLEDQNKGREGAKRRDAKPGKISKDSAAQSDSSNSSLSEVRTPTTMTKRTEKKAKQTQSGSLTSVSRNPSKSSLSEVSKPPTKTKKTKRKPMKTQSSLSTSVSRYSSKSSLNKVPKPHTKSKRAGRIPKESVSISSKTSCSCICSVSEVPELPINTRKSGEKPKRPTSNTPTTSVSKNRSTTSFHSQKKLKEKEEKIPNDTNSIISKKPGETVGSIKDIDMEKMHVSSDREPEVENKQIESQIEENKYRQIQKEREWIDPAPPIAMAAPRAFPNECGMCQGLEYQTHCMPHGYNAGPPPMYQTPQYPGPCYQQTWPNCQRNGYLWDNAPQIARFYQGPCSATATRVESRPSRPLVEVLKCEPIEPVRKPSVGFYPCLPTEPIEPPRKASGSLCTCLPTATQVGSIPCRPLVEVIKCEPVRKTSGGFCPCLSTSTTVGSCPCTPLDEVLKCEQIEPVRKPSVGFYLCLPTETRVGPMPCRPLDEVMKCEQLEPVRKPSVGFCKRPQVISEYSYPTTQGSQCQSSCMQQTPGDCSQRCGQNWTIPISSSTEYNRKRLLKRALCRNASPIDSLGSRFPRGTGTRCNSKSSAKSICFRVCPSQPQICNENRNTSSRAPEKKCESNERSMASSCRTNHQHLPSDHISTGGETIGSEGSQCSSVSRETKSVSVSILEYTDQEYYFPLTDKSQRSNRSSNFQEKSNDNKTETCRSLNDEIVIKVSVHQSNASRGSGKKKEVCSLRKPTSQPKVNDNMSYNQHKSRDGIYEDNIIVNFTNRSFSINSEEFERSTLEEQQRSTDEDLASVYSANTCSRDQSLCESIRTDEEDDIDEAPSTSRKNVQEFESRLIYSKLNRQSSTERSDLYQESESLTYISFNSGERYSKHRPIPCTRHLSGMCKQSNSNENQAKKQQKSPKINIHIPVLINKKKRSSSAPGCSSASEPRNGKSKSETPVIYRQNLSPRNQIPEKLTQGSDNVQDAGSDTELEHAKHIPSERIQENDNRKDKNLSKIPDYSLKASMMQAMQRSECRCFIPSQELGRTHQNESNDTELDHAKHIPSERIQENDNRKDKNLCKIPDYSLKASMMQAKHRSECRCFIPIQQLGRTHQNESNDTELDHEKHIPSERIRKKDNRKDKNLCKIPDYSLKASSMQAKQRSECRCFIPSQQVGRTQNVPRYMPDYQNKQHRSPRNVENPNADYQDSRQNPIKKRNTIIDCQPDEWTDPTSAELQTESDESYQVPEIRGQPRRPSFQERSPSPCRQNKRSPHMRSPHNKDIPKMRHRKPSSEEEYFHGYISRPCRCQRKTLHGKMNSTSDIYPESRNNSRYIHGKNNQIISSESEPLKGNSDSESAETSLLASKEESEDSRSGVCKPNSTYSKFVQSGRATDTEPLKTLLQPRRLRCNESTTVWSPDEGTGNTVLLEIRTTCKKDHLLRTCARPPCYCLGHNARIPPANVPVQSPNLHPENASSLKESYLIDPRNRWSTAAQAPSCQMQIDPHHPGYHPQVVKEAIKNLPIGFYDQTIQHYNVIRMDSDFEVPPFGSEVIQAVQAFPQSHCGCPVCPYGNPMQQQMMRPVQDFNRPYFLPQNHIQQRLPMGTTPFCPRHSKY